VKRYLKIAFEGGEAVGKATQTKMLAERFGATLFSFPNYNTASGQAILSHLKNEWHCEAWAHHGPAGVSRWNMMAFQALMSANRYEAAGEIERAAERGHIVFDRYALSGIVYGTVEGLDPQWLWSIHHRLPQPDAWILLDASVDESFTRRPERRDRNERDREKLIRIRREYLRVFDFKRTTRPSECWEVVDATGDPKEVHERICALLRGHFGRDVIDDMRKAAP